MITNSMNKLLTTISIIILLKVFNLSTLFGQYKIDTVHLSHSPFLEYEMGYTLKYTNYAPDDFKKINSLRLTSQERLKITSKYYSEKLEFVATNEGWYNPLNFFRIEFNREEYFFTFPYSTYQIGLKDLNNDLVLVSSDKSKLWKFDGQTINLVLHYKEILCVKTVEFKTSIPYEFLLSEYENGLVMFEVIIENELEHQLKSEFRIR